MVSTDLFSGVIQASVFPDTAQLPQVSEEQTEELYAILKRHALQTLPGKAILKLPMPQPLRTKWEADIDIHKLQFAQYLYDQNQVVSLLTQANISYSIIKGAVCAANYPRPFLRSMGDIDLLVSPRDREQAVQLLLDAGYQPYGYQDSMEQAFRKGRILLELHMGITADGKYSDRINALLQEQLSQVQLQTLCGYSFATMPKLYHGLLMLEHMKHHFQSNLGFRQVVDWMLYVHEFLTDDIWYSQMQPLLHSCGLEQFAITITGMCQQYFGLGRNNITWTQPAEPRSFQALFSHIYEAGNFGTMNRANAKSVAGLLRYGTPLQLWKQLQKSGKNNWSLYKKYPLLKPFAWIYQIFYTLRYVREKQYNKSVTLLIRERSRLRRVRKLMKQLGLEPEK